MKIAMIAFSVKGAMGQYLETLVSELRNHLDICLVVPKSFGQSIPNVRTINFETAENKNLDSQGLPQPTVDKKGVERNNL